MNNFESDLELLKQEFSELWELVSVQLKNSLQALSQMDKELAKQIIAEEKKVNELEMTIERHCENMIALYNPVAVDLRFILALIKINSTLERLGDIAEKISKFVIKQGDEFYVGLIAKTDTLAMFEEACDLLEDAEVAFKNNDTQRARQIFKRDEYINEINKNAFLAIIDSMKESPGEIEKYLKMLTLIRRIEKAGDLVKAIAEEIVFYIEAKILRHREKEGKG